MREHEEGDPQRTQRRSAPLIVPLKERRRLGSGISLQVDVASVLADAADDVISPHFKGESGYLHEHFSVIETLGYGSLSFVHKAKRKEDGRIVALKSTKTDDLEIIRIAEQEYEMLRDIAHPNIVRAIDFFSVVDRTVLVLDFFDSLSLARAVRLAPGRCFPEDNARTLFLQLMKAIDFLHQRRIVHRDVKGENVLVSRSLGDLKLTDFNTARRLAEGGALTMTGTQEYSPPEVLLGESPSESSDVWSAGLCLYLMLAGHLPRYMHTYRSVQEFGEVVASKNVVLAGLRWEGISGECKETLRACLTISRNLRPAAMSVLTEFKWLHEDPPPVRRQSGSVQCLVEFQNSLLASEDSSEGGSEVFLNSQHGSLEPRKRGKRARSLPSPTQRPSTKNL